MVAPVQQASTGTSTALVSPCSSSSPVTVVFTAFPLAGGGRQRRVRAVVVNVASGNSSVSRPSVVILVSRAVRSLASVVEVRLDRTRR